MNVVRRFGVHRAPLIDARSRRVVGEERTKLAWPGIARGETGDVLALQDAVDAFRELKTGSPARGARLHRADGPLSCRAAAVGPGAQPIRGKPWPRSARNSWKRIVFRVKNAGQFRHDRRPDSAGVVLQALAAPHRLVMQHQWTWGSATFAWLECVDQMAKLR